MKYVVAGVMVGFLTIVAGTIKVAASSEAGLRIKYSDIQNNFSRYWVKYWGECPGEFRAGIAEDGDLRFISRTTEPDKKLKVSLTNLRTGKKIERAYKKPNLGSNDFNLTQLGNSNGKHEVKYAIYNKDTNKSLETGTFTYNVDVFEETRERRGNWKLEHYCLDEYKDDYSNNNYSNHNYNNNDNQKKLGDCRIIGSREVKYCQGQRTRDIHDLGIVNLDRDRVDIDIDIR